MVLDDIARGADAVVVAGSAAYADVLGHRDLHVVDIVGVPDWLEHLVGEAQGKEVLDRLLAEVMIDSEDRVRGEDRPDDRVQLTGTGQIVTEWLLDHDSPPGASCVLAQATVIELPGHGGEERRRDREVEDVVAGCSALCVEVVQSLAEHVEGVRVVECALDKTEAFGQVAPHLLVEGSSG